MWKQFWSFWLLPAKFYGGGGGTQIVNEANPQQEALANIAQQKWDTYQRSYVPMENAYISQNEALNDPMYKQQATGMAAGGVQQSAGPQTSEFGRSMVGGRMGSAAFNGLGNSLSGAKQAANSGVTNRYITGEQGLVDMGNGQSTQAIQGLSSLADQSVNAQGQNAQNAWGMDQANQSVYGAGLGAGTGVGLNYLSKSGAF